MHSQKVSCRRILRESHSSITFIGNNLFSSLLSVLHSLQLLPETFSLAGLDNFRRQGVQLHVKVLMSLLYPFHHRETVEIGVIRTDTALVSILDEHLET